MAKKTTTTTTKKVNPFDSGVTYVDFFKALKDVSVSTYLKGVCTNDQIEWLENDIKNNYKKQ
tara:strand:+ start:243 stop:428 length:186 start_codon:yes stop_codon:yes gene_type:complete